MLYKCDGCAHSLVAEFIHRCSLCGALMCSLCCDHHASQHAVYQEQQSQQTLHNDLPHQPYDDRDVLSSATRETASLQSLTPRSSSTLHPAFGSTPYPALPGTIPPHMCVPRKRDVLKSKLQEYWQKESVRQGVGAAGVFVLAVAAGALLKKNNSNESRAETGTLDTVSEQKPCQSNSNLDHSASQFVALKSSSSNSSVNRPIKESVGSSATPAASTTGSTSGTAYRSSATSGTNGWTDNELSFWLAKNGGSW